jgi:peptidoglycan/LPS O-acetylase OafA/YrhL
MEALRSGRPLSDWLYSKLARVTSTGEYLSAVDGFRFLSILAVLLDHSTYHFLAVRTGQKLGSEYYRHFDSRLVHLFFMGHVGVLLFFAISGFVLGLPFARAWIGGRPQPSLRNYFLRRITRIEPPYILNLAICFLFVGGVAFLAARERPFVASLFYLHNIIYGKYSTINNVAWSLEIEVQFYVLAPLLAYVFAVKSVFWRRLILISAMAAFGILAHVQLIPHGPAYLRYTLLSFLQYFLAGFLLADLYETGALRRRGFLWDGVALVAAAGLVYGIGWQWPRTYWLMSFPVLLLWIAGFRGRIANWFFTLRPIATFGGMCYTTYLWHNFLLIWTGGLFAALTPRSWPLGAQVLFANAITLPVLGAACAVLFYFTEKPFMGNGIPLWISGKRRESRQLKVAAFAPQS